MCERCVKTKPMTRRRREVLTAIRMYVALHKCAPTLDQLGHILERSKPTIWQHVQELRRSGFIESRVRNGRIVLRENCKACGQSLKVGG